MKEFQIVGQPLKDFQVVLLVTQMRTKVSVVTAKTTVE